MREFSEGQMVRCIKSPDDDGKYVGAIGQVIEKRNTPFRLRLSAAMSAGIDIGNYIYVVKFAGYEAQYCSKEGCQEPHYPVCIWHCLEPIQDPDEGQEHEEEQRDEDLVATQ